DYDPGTSEFTLTHTYPDHAARTVSVSICDEQCEQWTVHVAAWVDPALEQTEPTSGTMSAGTPHTDQLHVDGASGDVTYTVLTPAPAFGVSASREVAADATLLQGTYTGTGRADDAEGNWGPWSYGLTVQPSPVSVHSSGTDAVDDG